MKNDYIPSPLVTLTLNLSSKLEVKVTLISSPSLALRGHFSIWTNEGGRILRLWSSTNTEVPNTN
jgi:hypothetical protein